MGVIQEGLTFNLEVSRVPLQAELHMPHVQPTRCPSSVAGLKAPSTLYEIS